MKAELTEMKSSKVKPPRIAESFGWLECLMVNHIEVFNYIWIIGQVLEVEVKKGNMNEVLDVEKVKPLNHIFGKSFVTEMKMTQFKRAS